jgi:DNA-binding NarL/FixJ family response regulator
MNAIVAAVDDLMFSSRIATAAKQMGIEVAFARSSEDVLSQSRAKKPGLIIFDLNATRLDPIGTIKAIKADEAFGETTTLGFVSHVDSDVIAAARAAGIDEVLARSAFTARLAEILTTG